MAVQQQQMLQSESWLRLRYYFYPSQQEARSAACWAANTLVAVACCCPYCCCLYFAFLYRAWECHCHNEHSGRRGGQWAPAAMPSAHMHCSGAPVQCMCRTAQHHHMTKSCPRWCTSQPAMAKNGGSLGITLPASIDHPLPALCRQLTLHSLLLWSLACCAQQL